MEVIARGLEDDTPLWFAYIVVTLKLRTSLLNNIGLTPVFVFPRLQLREVLVTLVHLRSLSWLRESRTPG